jgi:hypothetical protein
MKTNTEEIVCKKFYIIALFFQIVLQNDLHDYGYKPGGCKENVVYLG